MSRPIQHSTNFLSRRIALFSLSSAAVFFSGICLITVSHGVSLLLAAIIASVVWSKGGIYIAGLTGEKRVERVLQRILPRDLVVLHNVILPSRGDTTQVDHLVIGRGGIIVIESKAWTGHISIDPAAPHWIQEKRVGMNVITKQVHNPVRQNYGHMKAVQDKLKQRGISAPIHSLIVFSSDKVSLSGAIRETKRLQELRLSDFFGIMSGTEYLHPQTVASLLTSLQT